VRGWLTVLFAAASLAVISKLVLQSWLANGRLAWDATTYLAAGERLNAHHLLYALSPGDRWIWINPPYWSVPILYPPPIAVLWQPLAALPAELGVGIWALADAIMMLVAVGWIVARVGLPAAVAALILAPAVAWELGVANLHGFILAALVLVYERPRAGAVAIGLLAAIKLTPVIILVWLAATRRRSEALLGAIVAASTFALAVAVVGAGQLGAYLDAVRAAEPSVLSIPGLLQTLGMPPMLAGAFGWGLTVFGVVEVVALRRSPLAWPVAVATMVFGSPVVNVPTFTLLFAALLPLAGHPPVVRADHEPRALAHRDAAQPSGVHG
jgi:hypothetical protein